VRSGGSGRLLVLVGPIVVVGCDGAERRDAETVVAAVGRFRTADFAGTPAAVEALRATPCQSRDTCEARETCVAAGDAMASALKLKAEVARGIQAMDAGTLPVDSEEAKALPKKLADVESRLQRGRDALPACDERVQALKRKHRI
jgi:hypothetical protein